MTECKWESTYVKQIGSVYLNISPTLSQPILRLQFFIWNIAYFVTEYAKNEKMIIDVLSLKDWIGEKQFV